MDTGMKLTSVCGVVQIRVNYDCSLYKKCLVLLCVRRELKHAETRKSSYFISL